MDKQIGMGRFNPRGRSYEQRVSEVNRIYDEHVKSGLSNREIWRRYIHPQLGICERAFYKMLKASGKIGRNTDGESILQK